MSRFLLLFTLILCSRASALVSADTPLFIAGEAFDPQSGSVVYREQHYCDQQTLKCNVKYQDADGVPMLEKRLDYSVQSAAPDFQQLDLRTGRYIEAISGDISGERGTQIRIGDVAVSALQRNVEGMPAHTADAAVDIIRPAEFDTTLLQASDALVIDAGFDNFVRQQWQALIDGDTVSFSFAVPARGVAVAMSIKPLGKKKCAALVSDSTVSESTASDSTVQCFQLSPKNLIYKVFLKPIQLAYDSESRRLLAFKGLSSIKDNDNNAQVVLIRYRYP